MERNLFNSVVADVRVDLYPRIPASQWPVVQSARDAYNLFRNGWNEINYRETMMAMYLNQGNKVIGIKEVAKGGITSTIVDVRLIFQAALGCNATNIIIAHNHPSGNLNYSSADKNITEKIKTAGQFLDIRLLDHLILTDEGYYSFADDGQI